MYVCTGIFWVATDFSPVEFSKISQRLGYEEKIGD